MRTNERVRGLRGVRIGLLALLLAGCPAGDQDPPHRDILGTETKRYSQHDEELIIRDFFQDRRGGVFLDVGAAHFQRDSTTFYLEKHLGWTGIAVDALPEWEAGYRRNRPGTRFFQYIVTDHSGAVQEFYRAGTPEVSSTIRDRKIGERTVQTTRVLKVPTITLNELLERSGLEKIDLLSMDIEGGAPTALAGFDIERYRPELVCIESGAEKPYREDLRRYFEEHGYQLIEDYLAHDWVNWYFRPGD